MQIASIKDFFEEIVNDLHTSLYLGLGGSIEEETFDWKSQAVELTSTGIKILILLAILGFFYWLTVYMVKQSRTKIRLNERRTKIVRSVLRYIWIVASFIAI
ncbi:MAG: mechanosensitive ion channel family protein, partial [Psychrobacter alimentarius]